MLTAIYNMTFLVAANLLVYDAIILFIKGKNNRPRQMLGITILSWGLMYLLFYIANRYHLVDYSILNGYSLISSHIFIWILFLFPLEVLLPGWLNYKKAVLMLTPFLVITSTYYLGMKLAGESVETLMSFQDLYAHIGRFNVWFRFIMLTGNFFFIYVLLHLLNMHESKYLKWQNENFSDLDSVDISWMIFYKHMMWCVCLCYVFVAITGSTWSIIVHLIVVFIGFSILFYKALFYENSFPEDFDESISAENQELPVSEQEVAINENIDTAVTLNSFEDKLADYVKTLKEWMDTEKPYLYKDFKLADVTRILPLNRSYLSRVFNEGFHQNFSEVVRNYRIEYAKHVLLKYPEMPLYKVAEICGFTSDSTFIKAFQKVTQLTPRQFKTEL